jgi:hypothetical protein
MQVSGQDVLIPVWIDARIWPALFHLLLSTRQIIVQRIARARWQAVRDLAYDLDDIPHHVSASAPGDSAEQMHNCRPDFGLEIAGLVKIPIKMVWHNQANFLGCAPSACIFRASSARLMADRYA